VTARLAPLGVCAVGIALSAVWHPNEESAPLCPSRLLFGFSCPGCGMTRAVLALGRAEFGDAWRFHPLSFVLVGQLVLFTGLVATNRRAAFGGWFTAARGNWLIGVHAALLVLVWLVRWRIGALPVA
jgi:hypothetical protein